MSTRPATRRPDQGFTLVELLIVIAVIPLVAGAIAAGFITVLTNRNATQSRISDSHDAQITSEYFVRDVKSAAEVSTSGSTFCGRSSYLLGLAWYSSPSDLTVTSEAVYALGNGVLTRTTCGDSSDTTILAHDWDPQTSTDGSVSAAVTVDCSGGGHGCADAGTIPATATTPGQPSVSQITLQVTESHTGYSFSVSASPNGRSVFGAGCTTNCPGKGTSPPLHLIGSGATVSLGPNCTVTVTGTAATDNGTPGSISGGEFTATGIYWPGTSGQPATDSSAPVVSGPPLADPYDALTPPSPGDPGVTVVSKSFPSGTLSGIYYVSGDVSINSPVTDVAADGTKNPVLVYIAPGGSLSMKGNGSLTLAQPTARYGPIVVWAASSGQNVTLNGGSTLSGTIYDPNGTVLLNGGGNSGQISAGAIDANGIACNGGGTSVGFGAGPVATTTTVTATPDPALDGHTVTLKAHVSAADGSTVTEGAVGFTVVDGHGNTTADCATPVAVDGNGDATCQTAPLSASLSTYQITAAYQGTANYGPSTSPAFTETVLEPTTTTVSTTSTALHSGDTATFTATVTGNDGSSPNAGAVTFTLTAHGGTQVTSPAQPVTNGSANWTSPALYAGSAPYTVTASYHDTRNNPVYADSTSPALTVPVATAATTTTVVSSRPSARPSATVTFTATVSPTPTGGNLTWAITGPSGSNPPGCAKTTPLTAGQATCEVDGGWTAGQTYTVTASYSGDANFTGSSGSTTQTVASVATTIAGTVTKSKGKWVDSVTVTAADGSTPDGTVIFYGCDQLAQQSGCTTANATKVDTETLTGGKATSTGWNPATNKNTPYACYLAAYQGTADYLSATDTRYFTP